jgi:hypothetical protein
MSSPCPPLTYERPAPPSRHMASKEPPMDAAAPDPLGHPLNHEALCYINGAHFLGALPPIAVQNVLTEVHTQQNAPRPGAFGLHTAQ